MSDNDERQQQITAAVRAQIKQAKNSKQTI